MSFTRIFARAGCPGYVLHRGALHAALRAGGARTRSGRAPRWSRSRRRDGEVPRPPARRRRADRRRRCWSAPTASTRSCAATCSATGRRATRARRSSAASPTSRSTRPEISRELFGAGRRAAYYELGAGRVYWWATAPLAAGHRRSRRPTRPRLPRRRLRRLGVRRPEVIAATPAERILQNDIFDRAAGAPLASRARRPARRRRASDDAEPRPGRLHGDRGRDRARARDRRSRRLRRGVRALSSQPRRAARRRSCGMSRWWGRAGLWKHPALVALRDGAIRLGPAGLDGARRAAQYGYDPGPLPAAV